VKVDRRLEVLDVAEPPRRLLDPLDGGIDGLEACVGEPVPQVGQDVWEVPVNQLRHRRHRGQPAVSGPPEPAGEEGQGSATIGVVPELAEALLEGPRSRDLEVAVLQALEDRALGITHRLGSHEPEVLRPREARVVRLLQCPVLGLAHLVHRGMDVLFDVELIEDDLRGGVVHMRQRRLDVRFPHIHGDGLQPLALGGRQRGPEPVQALLLAAFGEIEDAAPVQIRDDGEVAMPLGDRFLVHAEMRDDLVLSAGEPTGDGSRLDPPRLIPGNTQQLGAALDRALAQQIDGEALEEGGKLAARLGPRDRELLDAMGWTLDAGDLRLDPGGELAGVQVSPAAAFPVVAGYERRTLGAGKRAVPGVHVHRDVLALHV